MLEHRIRLARAWNQCVANLPPRRIDLPTVWTEAAARQPFDLIRRFGRPPIDPTRQEVDLELVDLPGLRALWFNGQEIDTGRADASGATRIKLETLLRDRNYVRLAVDLTAVELDRRWGTIALVVKGRPE